MNSADGAPWETRGCCWIGGTRYCRPLDTASEKKWRALGSLEVPMHVIGFSGSVAPRLFTQYARFYLLPRLGIPLLRHLTMVLVAPFLLLWIVFRHGVAIVIAQSPHEGSVAAFVKDVARLFNRRLILIVESHGDFERSFFAYQRTLLAPLYRWPMRVAADYALRNADFLRAISGSTRRQLEAHAPGRVVEQFMTWTDADLFLGSSRGMPLADCWDVLYAGSLTPLKGVHVLLDAFALVADQAPQSRLWAVGKPEDARYADGLRRRVRGLGLEDRVAFVGEVSQAELAGLMGRVRVLVLPSFFEGLGRVLVEAMMCGTPVIGSQVGGIPEVIQDGENGYLVPAGDVGALAGALSKMFADQRIDAMGRHARESARSVFSANAYLAGHRRLLERARALEAARVTRPGA